MFQDPGFDLNIVRFGKMQNFLTRCGILLLLGKRGSLKSESGMRSLERKQYSG